MLRSELRIIAPLAFFGTAYGIAQTSLIPALPAIEHDLHTSAVGATSIVSVFFVSGAVTSGVFGRLGDMYGKRRLIVLQLLLALAGLVLCAVAPNLPLMIAGRALMGAVSGVFPLAFSILRDEFALDRVPAAIALVSGLAAGGGAIGQVVGGVVTDGVGFRWIFWVGAIMFASAAVAVQLGLRESTSRAGGRVDAVGAALLACLVGAPLVAISEASTWGWSDRRTVLLLSSVAVVMPVLVAHERRARDPLLSLPTLVLPQVRMTNIATFLVGFGMFGPSAIVSQFVQAPASTGYGFGVDATHAALFLVPGTTLMLVSSPLVGWLTRRAGAKATLMLGCASGCISLTGMAIVHGRPLDVYVWALVLYAGLALSFGVLPLLILQVVPPELRGQSTGVNLILRTIGSALGLQVAAMLVASSEGAAGVPAEGGFAAAFGLEAAALAAALLLSCLLPRGRAREQHVGDPALAPGT